MSDLKQALKDFVATSNSGIYEDEATLLSKFPELKGYDINVLKDFVATSNSGSYQTEDELFEKFPEFSISTEKLKKKGQGPMAQMVPQNTTESFIQESLSASKPKVAPQPKQKAGILAQQFPKPTTESFLETVSAEPSTQAIGVKKQQEPVAQAPIKEKNYFQGDFGALLNVADVVTPFGLGEFIDDMGRAINAGNKSAAFVTPSNQLILDSKKYSPETLKKFYEAGKEMDNLGPSDEMQKFRKFYDETGGGFLGFIKSITFHPEAIPEILVNSYFTLANASSAAAALPVLATGTAIGGATANVPGAVAGFARSIPLAMGAASTVMETGLTFGELLKDELANRKLDWSEENIKTLLEDDKFVSSIRGKAAARGVTIGLIDAITGKIAGRVGAKILAKGTKAARVQAGVAAATLESGGGSLGEAAGRLVAGQPMDEADIYMEGIANLPMAAPAIVSEVLNKPIYKINGDRVTESDMKGVVDNTPAPDLAKIDFEFINDRAGYKKIVQDKVVTYATREQVREANPDLNETSLDAITKLELDLQKLQGNTTQSGKDKSAALRGQIKNIQENQLQEEAAVETLKAEQDAIQKQTAGQVPVQSETGVSVQVAEGEPQAEPQGVTQEGKGQEVEKRRQEELKEYEGRRAAEFVKLNKEGANKELTEEEVNEVEEIIQAAIDNGNVTAEKLFKMLQGQGYVYGPYGSATSTIAYLNNRLNGKTEVKVGGNLIDDTNAKYDAELAALEPQGVTQEVETEEVTPQVSSKTQVEEVTVNDEVLDTWNKYKVGESFNVTNPEKQLPQTETPLSKGEYTLMAIPISSTNLSSESNKNGVPLLSREYWETSTTPFMEDELESLDRIKKGFNTKKRKPIVVEKKSDGSYEVMDGHHRLTIAKELGKNTILALVKDEKIAPTPEVSTETQTTKIQSNEQATTQPQQNEQVQSKRTGDGGISNKGREITPLEGSPNVPDADLVSIAEQYAKENGIDLKRQSEYVKVDEKRAKRIADAYEKMANDPQNPKVKKAYEELIKQTRAQYDALIKAGYEFTFFDDETDPYGGSPNAAMSALRNDKKMAVYGTFAGYGTKGITDSEVENNPLLADTGLRWKDQTGKEQVVTANDLFRAVHDAFGHGLEGAGFRARGEENAWQAHARLFTGPAIGALTSETRGQNSWLNFGPYGDKNRTAKVEDTIFAENKIGLMPEWTWTEGRAGDMEVEGKPTEEKAPAKKAKTEAVPVQVDEQLPSKLQELVDSFNTAFFTFISGNPTERAAQKKASKESIKKLTDSLGANFSNIESDEDKLVSRALRSIREYLNKEGKRFKYNTIDELVAAYQADKTKGTDSDLVKSVDILIDAQKEAAKIEAAATQAVAEGEQFIPLTENDIQFDTKFDKNEASNVGYDEKEGSNGRMYEYVSEIEVPVTDVNGDEIGYIVKYIDEEKNLMFEAINKDGDSLSKNEERFDTLGEARQAFLDDYNKKTKKEFDREAKAKAKEKAKQEAKAAAKAAKAAAKEGAAKVEEVQSLVDELLALDPNDKSTAQKWSDGIGKAIKDVEKFEKTSLGVNVALPIIKGILQAVKALIDAGISLQQAFKQVAKDNNITEQQVKDNINIVPILNGFNEVMAKVDAIIARQKSKNIPDAKIISNVDTFIRNSDVYKAANDAQKKILEKEGRAKMGAEERRAPSIGRVLGALQDFTNISREEKIQIIKKIRTLSKDAASSLAKEIKEMRTVGKITVTQAANIIARFGKVNLLNEISVANFVDYMAKVFNDAEYAQKIDTVKKQLAIAKKNIATKIGKADGLMIPLQKLFAINPNLIPDSVFDDYIELVNMFGQRQAVLTLAEKSEVIKQVEAIKDALDKEQSLAVELAMRLEEFKGVKFNENGRIDYAATIKAMLEDKAITEEEAELMRKYKSDIVTQVEPEPKSAEEIEAEKQVLLDALDKTEVTSSGLSSKYERDLGNRLAKLIKTDAVDKLSVAELKNLLKVIDNINNNYMPHFAQLMVERLNSINNDKTLVSSLNRAKLLPITKAYANVKSLFTGKNAVSEMIRRNPLFLVDQMLGDFKTKDVFNALLNKAAEGVSAFHTELNRVQNILENAETKVAKSFNMDPNKTLMSKFKMMTYMIQLEFESNKGNKQVNQASDFIKATIKHIKSDKSTFGKLDAKVLSEILSTYANEKGNIDINKLYNSFNDAEKSAIKDIRSVNESLAEKAEDTSTIIRGQKFNPLNNYVHLNVLHETEPRDLTVGTSFANEYNNSRRPSTKAKSLIERTGEVSPLNFDVFSSAQRGAKFVLLDYNLTEPIRTGRRTLDLAQITLQQEADEKARAKARTNGLATNRDIDNITGEIDEKQQDILNALRNAYEEAVSNLLTNSMASSSIADAVAQYMTKQGYRAVLASTGRFQAELMSNIAFAVLVDPKAFSAGLKDTGFILSADAVDFMNNVKSKQTSRIFPTDTLSGRAIDTNIINQSVGIVGGRTNRAIANRTKQIWNLSGKKYLNTVELTADALITTPDKAVMRPMWFGSFMNEFEKITGEKVDKQKIAENDEAYMNKYKDAIEKAKTIADERSVLTGATDNAFMGILKGTVKPDQSGYEKAFNTFNNYMTKFMNFEFAAARTGAQAAMGNGSLTKKQGVAVLAGVTTRMIVYSLLIKALGNGLMGLLFGSDDEEDDKSFFQQLGQATASAFTSLLIGRDFGNITKQISSYGVELLNEEYLDILREGKYDAYNDSLQYSLLSSKDEGSKGDLYDLLANMVGPFSPALKTANFAYKKMTEKPKKDEGAIERQRREINERLPLEVFGNLGAIPLYKEIRKIVMADIYKSLVNAERDAANKKKAELEMLQGYKTKSDMERYDPELYERTYGPSSEGYDEREAERILKLEAQRMKRAIKDEENNYIPQSNKDGFGGGGFGTSKSRSKSDGFGSNDGFN